MHPHIYSPRLAAGDHLCCHLGLNGRTEARAADFAQGASPRPSRSPRWFHTGKLPQVWGCASEEPSFPAVTSISFPKLQLSPGRCPASAHLIVAFFSLPQRQKARPAEPPPLTWPPMTPPACPGQRPVCAWSGLSRWKRLREKERLHAGATPFLAPSGRSRRPHIQPCGTCP